MFGIWPKWKCIQVEVSCLIIETFKRMSYPQIDPNSNIVGTDIQSSMVESDSFISPSKMSKSCSNFVHKQVVSWVLCERTIEKINSDFVLSLDEE